MPRNKKPPIGATCFPHTWFDGMPTPIFILDRMGKILYANQAFCNLIGKKSSNCKKEGPMDLMIEAQENRRFLKDLLQVYRGLAIKRRIYTLNVYRKTTRVLLDVTPVYNQKNKIVECAIGLILDSEAQSRFKRLRNFFLK